VWLAAADAVFDAACALAGAGDEPSPNAPFLKRRVQEAAREFERADRYVAPADLPDDRLREAAGELVSRARGLAEEQVGPEPAGEQHASLAGARDAMRHYATQRGLPDPSGKP
jgi:hypothetical protein